VALRKGFLGLEAESLGEGVKKGYGADRKKGPVPLVQNLSS